MPGGPQLDDAVVGPDVGQVVAGVGEHEPPGRGVEDRVQAGHEHVGRHLGHQQLVGPGEDLARAIGPLAPRPAGSSGCAP